MTLSTVIATADERVGPLYELLARVGPGTSDPRVGGLVQVLLAYDPDDPGAFGDRLERLFEAPEPHLARPAGLWLSHVRENAGDPAGAVAAAERVLALGAQHEGPWVTAMLRNQLAALTMQLGDRASAVAHARAALPVMERLGAKDDEVQLRSLLALCAIADERLADAEAELRRIDEVDDGDVFGGIAVRQIGRAELALARGDRAGGLRAYRACAASMRELRFPGLPSSGLEPWVVFGESTALTAHAHHAAGADEAHGRALFGSCSERTRRLLAAGDPQLDFPVAGGALFALGAWSLLHDAPATDHAVRLLALADRFAYNRTVPTMAWGRIAPRAEERAPGLVDAVRAGYGGRRPHELLGEASEVVARLAG
jgi:hypothetical protein